MRLTLDALAVLDVIDRKGSFAAAAEELHRVPSAITYTIQKLEQDLDVVLFDRSRHRARLTPAGAKLLSEGRHLLRSAGVLEQLVKRVATGWEVELNIAVDNIIPLERFYPLLVDFYRDNHGTRLRFSREVLGGTWDALLDCRADLVVGAAGDGPAGGGYTSRLIGAVEFIFVVAPGHPLATAPEPLSEAMIQRYRAVAVADSSRNLPPRTSALLSGQDVLTVPDLAAKCEAQRRGLGIGYAPCYLVQDDLDAGRLITKRAVGDPPSFQLFIAWRTGRSGRALHWFVERLEDPRVFSGIIS